MLSLEKTAAPRFHAGEERDLISSLGPVVCPLPSRTPGPRRGAGSAGPLCAGAAGPAPASPPRREPQRRPRSCRSRRAPRRRCSAGGDPAPAWSTWINQCFGLVFSYYGQYIKGIYLRKCLSCQSFPKSSILNTPYNYRYYPGKFSP